MTTMTQSSNERWVWTLAAVIAATFFRIAVAGAGMVERRLEAIAADRALVSRVAMVARAIREDYRGWLWLFGSW